MEDKIEVGEYVRTREGYIGILIDINIKNLNYLTIDCKRSVRRDFLYPDSYLYLTNEDIVKHSKNIIDIIKVGDIVELTDVLSQEVIYIWDEEMLEAVKQNIEEGQRLKSILTREEFTNRKYEV